MHFYLKTSYLIIKVFTLKKTREHFDVQLIWTDETCNATFDLSIKGIVVTEGGK